ncbi:MAG TPA: NAD(P)-dependent oxidoreductase [Vicinamibacteria bacterium]
MRIAVTGANGFVGRELVGKASAAGWEVTGIVRSEEGAAVVKAAGGRPVMTPLAGPDLVRACAGAQAVVHLAQIGSEKRGQTYEAVNVGGTRQVLEAARAAGVPRLVYFSGLGVAHYGQAPRCSNDYFLSKLSAELLLYSSDRQVVVFRPSYIVGPGDGLVRSLLGELAQGAVEWPGDGGYRLQPVAVSDAAAAVLAAATLPPSPIRRVRHRALDLVGPEALGYRDFVARLARAAAAQGRPAAYEVHTVPVEEADRQAAAGGYRGMLSDELDCLLCDEVSDSGPLAALLGRPLAALDEALALAVSGTVQ